MQYYILNIATISCYKILSPPEKTDFTFATGFYLKTIHSLYLLRIPKAKNIPFFLEKIITFEIRSDIQEISTFSLVKCSSSNTLYPVGVSWTVFQNVTGLTFHEDLQGYIVNIWDYFWFWRDDEKQGVTIGVQLYSESSVTFWWRRLRFTPIAPPCVISGLTTSKRICGWKLPKRWAKISKLWENRNSKYNRE